MCGDFRSNSSVPGAQPQIARLAACLWLKSTSHIIPINHKHDRHSENWLTHQSTAVTDPPQSWVSHEIHVTSAQLPEQSERTTARRGMGHAFRERFQPELRKSELLRRAANLPTPVSAPNVSISSVLVAAIPNTVLSVSRAATSPGVPKA